MLDDDNNGTLVLSVQTEERYGQYRLVGRVSRLNEAGEMLGTSWRYGGHDLGAEFDGFEVHAYLGNTPGLSEYEDTKGLWGFGHSYAPYSIETAKQAQAIARVLTRLEKGLDRLNTDEGYSNDFDVYLRRVAKILRLKEIHVRNLPGHWSGERWRKVTGNGLQDYCKTIDTYSRDSRKSELVR